MEWVEVTGRTVEEAKDAALDELGVDESEAEFEVLQEPKAGLFGRLRSEARVRARVAPTSVRPKVDRGSRRRGRKERGDEAGSSGQGGSPPAGSPASAVAARGGADSNQSEGAGPTREGPAGAAGGPGGGPSTREVGVAAGAADGGKGRSRARLSGSPAGAGAERRSRPKPAPGQGDTMDHGEEPTGDVGAVGEEFLLGLVAAFGIKASVRQTELDDGDTVELAVDGSEVGMLIGPRGQTLSAIQELTRTYASRRAGDSQPRIVIDVGGYRKARREALERFTRDVAAQVVATGVVKVLEPMPPADRKVVHDTANTIDGVSTTSEGEEPRRRVVIQPTSSD